MVTYVFCFYMFEHLYVIGSSVGCIYLIKTFQAINEFVFHYVNIQNYMIYTHKLSNHKQFELGKRKKNKH